jgi:hypothetical protein
MSLAVHHNSEIGKFAAAAVALVVFVVVAMTWLPEMLAPQGGPGAPDTGQFPVRLVR